MKRKLLRLHMSEMPYPPPRTVVKAARNAADSLHRYADFEEIALLKELLASSTGVDSERIVPGPGSDILLRELILSMAWGRKLVLVSPSFLPTLSTARKAASKSVALRLSPPDFELPQRLLFEELDEASLVLIEHPNNPTGKLLLDRKTIEAVLTRKDSLLVLDEAYYEFSGSTCADLVEKYPNLAVSRTMDKSFSLAGARVGYLLLGDAFRDAFASFSALLPRPSLAAAMAALKSPDYVGKNIQKVIEEREKLGRELNALGLSPGESRTNFILLSTGVPEIVRELKSRGILVADVSGQLGPGYIRIGIGRPEENTYFLEELKKVLRKYSRL
jgi:histidinol-phosphate aminotransferase